MKEKCKNKWSLVFIVVIVSLSFTMIPGWIPFARKEWYFLVLGTIGTAIVFQSYFTSNSFFCILFYFVILFFNMLFGDATFSSMPVIIYEVLQFLVPSAICFYALLNSDKVFIRIVVIIVFAIICIESVASYYVNLQYPNIIRELESLTRAEGNRSFSYSFMKMGLANYSFAHALPIAIPPIISLLKNKTTRKKWLWIMVLFLLCLLIYVSSSGTAIILMVLMMILGVLTNNKGLKNNTRLLLISMILFSPLLFSQSIQIKTIDAIEGVLPNDAFIVSKLESIKYSIEYEQSEGDVEARVVRYNTSWDGFKENILLGSNKKLGGHSSLLDRLGNLGLLGIIPLFLFFFLQIKKTLKYIPDKHKVYYIEGIIAALLMFVLKSVGLWGLLLLSFVVLPFMLTEE